MIKSLWLLPLLVLLATGVGADSPPKAAPESLDPAVARQMVQDSMRIFRLADDVSVDDAVESMKLRANMLNFKLVADLPLSEQVESMGEDANYMRILAFCDALIAKRMVEYNIIFAGFLPCRVGVIEDAEGQGWIVTMNMDMMLNAVDLPPDLQPLAQQVRDTIYEIVDAGVNGDL